MRTVVESHVVLQGENSHLIKSNYGLERILHNGKVRSMWQINDIWE